MNPKEILLLIAPITFVVMVIWGLIDRPDCLKDINEQASECENKSSYPDCDVNAYCSKDNDECEYDVNKAVKGLCPEEVQKRYNLRNTFAYIMGIITGIEVFILTLGSATK